MKRVLSRIPRRTSRTVVGLAVALGLALTVGGNAFRAAPQGQTRTFLIVQSDQGIHYGKFEEDCPQGFEMTVEEAFLATKTPEERERLLRPENAKEYAKGWKDDFITGPGGENVCNNPKSFMNDPKHGPWRGVQSKVSYGMNLDGTPDGRATANTCGHSKFTGVNGEEAVDNQLYRAIGCSKMHRSTAPMAHAYIDPFLVEIRGIDDLTNDDHVEVGIYSTDDTPLQGSDGKPLPNQTLSVTRNARWRATGAGRIVNGELTTDVFSSLYLKWVMSTWGLFGQASENEFNDVRFKLTLRPDGTLEGLMAAYRPIDNIFTIGRCCKGTASTANNDCASEHKTLAMLADGYPDPETGQCTKISSASNLKGIPVFIVPGRPELTSRK
ncbi:MAG TPA: hypothetical protein VNZ26_12150 [Vicinamibacterales bacterium]|nr:hypothetical protein [Vicinamibacterales bacterium]